MTDLVPAEKIETIVGARRDPWYHLARAVSDEQMVYILHSTDCLKESIDLRDCDFSLVLDRGINSALWDSYLDRPVHVTILNGHLIPVSALEPGENK